MLSCSINAQFFSKHDCFSIALTSLTLDANISSSALVIRPDIIILVSGIDLLIDFPSWIISYIYIAQVVGFSQFFRLFVPTCRTSLFGFFRIIGLM